MIWLVDDSGMYRRLLSHHLAKWRVPMNVLGSGYEALAAWRNAAHRHPPAAIFTDLNMPDISGIDLAASLRREGYRGMIVVITGDAESGVTEAAKAAGCDAVVNKSIGPSELKSLVDAALERTAAAARTRSDEDRRRATDAA